MTITRRSAMALTAASWLSRPAFAQTSTPDAWALADAGAQKLIDERTAPGISLSVMKDGKFLYSKGFGAADLSSGATVRPDTVFLIASVTKHFTAAAILALAEDGKLSIVDPLARFIPEFPRADEITLEHLLGHTSGLSDYINGLSSEEEFHALGEAEYTQAQLLTRIEAITPLFKADPGSRYIYSNSNAALVGIVIERITGAPFGEFFRTRLFAPAGMTRSVVANPPADARNWATGYMPEAGSKSGFVAAPKLTASFASAAGAIRSTTEDLCRWQQALLAGKIIEPASLATLLGPVHLKDGSLPTAGNPPKPFQVGFTVTWSGEHRYFTAFGSDPGFSAEVRSYPAENLTYACLMNREAQDADSLAKLKAVRTAVLTAARGGP